MAKQFTTIEIIKLLNEGKDCVFYNSRGWRNLAREIKRSHNNECQLCKKRGKVSPAHTVHHVKHLRERPDLAYSRLYEDENGNKQVQLLSVCFTCHELIHGRLTKAEPKRKQFINQERW